MLLTLSRFGFFDLFVKLIANCLAKKYFSVCVNGMRRGFFPASRGLRQGDPMSPCLFILAEEVMSRGLKRLYQDGMVKGFHLGRGSMLVCHLLFADDTLVFLRGYRRSLVNLMNFLKVYELSSGQRVSLEKSSMFCSKHISMERRQVLTGIAGIPIKQCPFVYLGCPIIVGRTKVRYFESLIMKFKQKMEGWYAKLLSNMGRVLLAQVTLCVVPIHLLACLNLPVGVIRKLNSFIASFIWSSKMGVKKRHWVSWRNITLPKEEGGLGLRKFEDIQGAFRLKQAWNVMKGDSLWAQVFSAKFLRGRHMLRCQGRSHFKYFEMLRPFFEKVVLNSKMLVGRGDSVDFWCDNWLLGGPLLSRVERVPMTYPKVADVLLGAQWQLDSVNDCLSTELREEILSSGIVKGNMMDRLIWQYTTSGEFSTKTAWKLLRQQGARSETAAIIWGMCTAPSAQLVSWKILMEALPLDVRIQRLGFPIVSRCYMCFKHIETAEHLFVNCDYVGAIWKRLAVMIGFQLIGNEHPMVRLRRMCRVFKKRSVGHGLIRSVSLLVYWQVWNERCRRRAGEGLLHSYSIFIRVCSILRYQMRNVRAKIQDDVVGRGFLQLLGVEVSCHVIPRVNWVCWSFPEAGCFKLNVDGAAKGNPGLAGGGAILRNEWGGLVLAASFFYGECTNMEAEFKALLNGLDLVERYGLLSSKILIESDSLVLVQSVMGTFGCAWTCWKILCQIREKIGRMEFQLRHVFREANSVADSLANQAVVDGFSTDFSVIALTSRVKMALLQDQRRIPVARMRRMIVFDDNG